MTVAPVPWPGIVGLATDDDGPAIGKLYAESEMPDHGVEWDRPGVGAWWIIAKRDGHVVGAVQVCPGQPFGFIGDLVVHPSERARSAEGAAGLSRHPGALAFILRTLALGVLERQGSQIAFTNLRRDFRGAAKFWGATDLGMSRVIARRF